ncbi:MAG TPA: cytochrome c oxidase assembly protein, partial [Xanthomonadales bacterium]|nr:cytochrome c oxidase assembly protein [Xanthomonadales bacterium]
MTIALPLALTAALYAWGLLRVMRARRPFPRFAPLAFAGGIVAIGAVLFGPVDALSDASLSWHMVQHL